MLIKILLEFIYTGGFGVSMFFLLSGFIVPYSYVDIRSFFFRRIFRIFPVFLLACLLQHIIVGPNAWNVYSYSLLFADILHTPYILEGVDWTLRIEVMFYLYIALCLWSNKFNLKCVYITSFFILGLSIINKFYLLSERPLPLLYSNLLLIGALFYLKHRQLFPIKEITKCLYLICFNFTLIFLFCESIPYKYNIYPFLAIISFILCFQLQKLFKTNNIIIWLSNCSYSLYLLHIFLFKHILLELYFLPTAFSHIFSWVILLILCTFIHSGIENKLIRFSKKL